MTEIYNDNVQTTLKIDEDPWYVKEAEVVNSRKETPNYVDLSMFPDPEDTAPNLPKPIDNLIGAEFELHADNSLISERDTNAEEDTLLFAGNLANISRTGAKSFEGVAYDPGQQPFAGDLESGGLMNSYIDLGQPEVGVGVLSTGVSDLINNIASVQVIKASKLVEQITDKLGLEDVEIDLKNNGITPERIVDTLTDEDKYAYDRKLVFHDRFIKIKDALNRARERCEAEWWFDKSGTFHFGIPDPTRHELKFIVDTNAGRTTPPYQSVRVIGGSIASTDGYSRTQMYSEDSIVVEAELAKNGDGDLVPKYGNTKDPVFEYHSLEVTTDEQAKGVAKQLIEDLGEQQADGTITVVGFPEVVPMDGVVVPESMGGAGYGVYKVVHHLNGGDGFITKIHVAGVTGVTKSVVKSDESEEAQDPEDRYFWVDEPDEPGVEVSEKSNFEYSILDDEVGPSGVL